MFHAWNRSRIVAVLVRGAGGMRQPLESRCGKGAPSDRADDEAALLALELRDQHLSLAAIAARPGRCKSALHRRLARIDADTEEAERGG